MFTLKYTMIPAGAIYEITVRPLFQRDIVSQENDKKHFFKSNENDINFFAVNKLDTPCRLRIVYENDKFLK